MKSHLVVDSDLAKRIKRKKAREKQIETFRAENLSEIQDAGYAASRSNPAIQTGRALFHTDFEKRLKRLLPTAFFLDHPQANLDGPYKDVRAAYWTSPPAKKFLIGCYHRGLMPERTIHRTKETVVWDRTTQHIDRKDVPEQTFVPGVGFVKKDPNALTPGSERVIVPYGVARSGWRRLLVKLRYAGLLTPTQIETAFGRDETPEWAGHMGHRKVTTPW